MKRDERINRVCPVFVCFIIRGFAQSDEETRTGKPFKLLIRGEKRAVNRSCIILGVTAYQ